MTPSAPGVLEAHVQVQAPHLGPLARLYSWHRYLLVALGAMALGAWGQSLGQPALEHILGRFATEKSQVETKAGFPPVCPPAGPSAPNSKGLLPQ